MNLLYQNNIASAEQLLSLCRDKGVTLATAESCTGGMIGATITSVPGSSDVFLGGIISYANSAKKSLLNVKEDTLASHGAVSKRLNSKTAHPFCRICPIALTALRFAWRASNFPPKNLPR